MGGVRFHATQASGTNSTVPEPSETVIICDLFRSHGGTGGKRATIGVFLGLSRPVV